MGAKEIRRIIANRAAQARRIEGVSGVWKTCSEKVDRMNGLVKELKKTCLRARTGVSNENAQALQELEAHLEELERKQDVRKLGADCAFANSELAKLSLRFNRATLNIAVAGVGRCGKSTALKAIIGQNQADNSVIPSGSGPAVTAGKSTIRCVTSKDEERTEVSYHTVDSFLNGIVNPLLVSISLGNHSCHSVDDFEELDYELLKLEVAANGRMAEETVRALRMAPAADGNETERQARIAAAQAAAAAFKLHAERLNDLKRIMDAFPSFREVLTGKTETVPLSETSRFVSYPKDGGPAICYAVRNCCIYSRFPNNEVSELVLIDLPGLGTGSESEKKCFFEGFDYSVDLALAVRRPEGLFQNFTTEDDLTVLNVLGAVFGEEHLHECMILFQNDGGLPAEGTNPAFARIEEWNANREQPVEVIRGDAFSADFMQKILLPTALKFMERNLPVLDSALVDGVLPGLEKRAKEIDERLELIQRQLCSRVSAFRSTEGANAIVDKAIELQNGLLTGIGLLMSDLEDSLRADEQLSDAITELSEAAKKSIQERYDENNADRRSIVANRIRTSQSAVPYANEEVHAMRIIIGERFAQIGEVHSNQFALMRKGVASLFARLLPTVICQDDELESVLAKISADGSCVEIATAIKAILELDAPFYNIVYPDLRKEVFGSVGDVEKNILAVPGVKPEDMAGFVMQELRNTGENWVWKAECLLRSQSRIPDIICAALERLQDRLVRSASARREWVDFLERNWSKVKPGTDSCVVDLRNRIGELAGKNS